MQVQIESESGVIDLPAKELAKGGEGSVFEMPYPVHHLLAKVYHRPSAERAAKLACMVRNPPDDPMRKQGHVSIAWPSARLLSADCQRSVVGYVMPRIGRAWPISCLYHPGTRVKEIPDVDYKWLFGTAANLATAVAAVQARGYVIADVNDGNLLVNYCGIVTLLDTDSFQVKDGQRIFRCGVGVPEFTPPELQNVHFQDVNRWPESDAFGLAVLIFKLLMQGHHPFQSKFVGRGDPPSLPKKIATGCWPYRTASSPFHPPPHAPPWEVLPPQVRELFRRCFEDGHQHPSARPTAHAWEAALKEGSRTLTTCARSDKHWYHAGAGQCPWCRIAKRTRRDPFPGGKPPATPPGSGRQSPLAPITINTQGGSRPPTSPNNGTSTGIPPAKGALLRNCTVAGACVVALAMVYKGCGRSSTPEVTVTTTQTTVESQPSPNALAGLPAIVPAPKQPTLAPATGTSVPVIKPSEARNWKDKRCTVEMTVRSTRDFDWALALNSEKYYAKPDNFTALIVKKSAGKKFAALEIQNLQEYFKPGTVLLVTGDVKEYKDKNTGVIYHQIRVEEPSQIQKR